MGIIKSLLPVFFGNGRNIITDTVGAFRPNAEQQANRDHATNAAVMAQFAAEFGHKGWFNQFIDGINRLPRPVIAFGVIGLFVSAMFDPIWFAARMQGLSLVPEQLWMIFNIVIPFYFIFREVHKFRSASMAKESARILSQAPWVAENIRKLRSLTTPDVANYDVVEADKNPAVEEWAMQNEKSAK